jgi:hypothetical protein
MGGNRLHASGHSLQDTQGMPDSRQTSGNSPARRFAAVGMVMVSFLTPMALAAKPGKAKSESKPSASAQTSKSGWHPPIDLSNLSMDPTPKNKDKDKTAPVASSNPTTPSSANPISSAGPTANPSASVQPVPSTSASATATTNNAPSSGASATISLSQAAPEQLSSMKPFSIRQYAALNRSQSADPEKAIATLTQEIVIGNSRLGMKDGYGQLALPTVIAWVQPGASRVIYHNLLDSSALHYAYPLGPERVISGSSDSFSQENRQDVMRGLTTYNRAYTMAHFEASLPFQLLRTNDLDMTLYAGAFYDLLALQGQMQQLQFDPAGNLVPNANAPTTIKSNFGNGFQAGGLLELRLFKKGGWPNGLPIDARFRFSPGAGASSIGTSIMDSSGVSHSFDAKTTWGSMPWSIELRSPPDVVVTTKDGKLAEVGLPYVIRPEAVGFGAYGISSPFVYATVSVNYQPSDLALASRNYDTSEGSAVKSGFWRSLVTPQFSSLLGEKRYGLDVKVVEYQTIPQYMSAGGGLLADYNSTSEVKGYGIYGDYRVVFHNGFDKSLVNQNTSVFVRAGYRGENGGDDARRLGGTVFTVLGISGL